MDSYTFSLESFRSFRGPLIRKPVTGQELFFAASYSKPALAKIVAMNDLSQRLLKPNISGKFWEIVVMSRILVDNFYLWVLLIGGGLLTFSEKSMTVYISKLKTQQLILPSSCKSFLYFLFYRNSIFLSFWVKNRSFIFLFT